MTKLILIILLLGLQNPPPSNGKDGQPPQKQAASEQTNSPAANTEAKPTAVSASTPANHDAPKSQQGAADASNNHDDKSPPEGASASEIIMAITSVIMVVVGVGQLVMYWCQWQSMQKALSQTARIARKTLKHATDSSERGLRAYVGVISDSSEEAKNMKVRKVAPFPQSVIVYIKNSGQTPAYRVVVYLNWMSVQGFNAHWPENIPFTVKDFFSKSRIDNRGSSLSLGAGQVSDSTHLLSPNKGVTIDELFQAFRRKETTIFIYGVVAYEDIYLKARFTKFCNVTREFDDSTFVFITYDQHNDEEEK
ncbi:MAG: hypothetical protein LV481_14845 [Methylacidiphilales bacterium]|nr:hypothetical protein [Candidatus Methylacidiphilales bacterium]